MLWKIYLALLESYLATDKVPLARGFLTIQDLMYRDDSEYMDLAAA